MQELARTSVQFDDDQLGQHGGDRILVVAGQLEGGGGKYKSAIDLSALLPYPSLITVTVQ